MATTAPGVWKEPDSAQTFITRPNMRDSIRRKKGLTPPIDDIDGAAIGEEPAGESWPSNVVLNQAIADSIREISRRTKFYSINPIDISVPAQSDNGPYWIPLSGHVMGTQNSINEVKRVVWTTGDTPVRLKPTDYRQIDRTGQTMELQNPGQPRFFFIEGYRLAIFPPPDQSGTITLWVGTGLPNFTNDVSTLDELPMDYVEVIEDLAVVKLCQMRPDQPMAMQHLQLYGAASERGIDDIIKWLARANEALQPSLVMASRRRIIWY